MPHSDQTVIRAKRLADLLDVGRRIHGRQISHQLARCLEAACDEHRIGVRDRLEFGGGGWMVARRRCGWDEVR